MKMIKKELNMIEKKGKAISTASLQHLDEDSLRVQRPSRAWSERAPYPRDEPYNRSLVLKQKNYRCRSPRRLKKGEELDVSEWIK